MERRNNTAAVLSVALLLCALVLGGVAYVRTANSGNTPAIDAMDGSSDQTFTTPSTFPTGAGGEWTNGPRYVAGNFVVPERDHLVAFDAVDGSRGWTSPDCPGATWATPFSGPAADYLVVECGTELVGLDGQKGILAWRMPAPTEERRTRTSTTLLVVQTESKVSAYDLATGAPRGEWVVPGDANAVANTTTVFASTNFGITAFDLVSGEVRWYSDQPASGLGATEDAAIARTNTHQMRAYDSETGAVLWETGTEVERLDSSEIIGVTYSTCVVQASNEPQYLTTYDLATGAKLWTVDPADDYMDYVVGTDDDLVVVSNQSEATITVNDARSGAVVRRLPTTTVYPAAIHGGVIAYITQDGFRPYLQVEPLG